MVGHSTPLLLDIETIFCIAGLFLLLFFFHRMAASALARAAALGTGLATVPDAVFLVARPLDGAAANRA